MRTIYLVLRERIVNYPPVLSMIDALLSIGEKVVFIGNFNGFDQKEKYEKKGVVFVKVSEYNGQASLLDKYLKMRAFKKEVSSYLAANFKKDDLLWVMHAETICLLGKMLNKYKTILHFFEYVDPEINWKYRLMSPSFDMGEVCRKAYKVVCCEYNRAHITKGLFQLVDLPAILPNKYFADEKELAPPPLPVAEKVAEIEKKVKGKTVILYQGVFLDKERRLEEFITAVNNMPDNYVLIAMGRGSTLFENLKKKYSSSRILFIDFINPPYHLLVTRLASVGILSYFPRNRSIATVINPLYCAPNKTFEYARYGIPMVSNDVPALYYTFKEFNCGEIVSYPMTPEKIERTITKIMGNKDSYSQSAREFYNSVDIISIIRNIVGK